MCGSVSTCIFRSRGSNSLRGLSFPSELVVPFGACRRPQCSFCLDRLYRTAAALLFGDIWCAFAEQADVLHARRAFLVFTPFFSGLPSVQFLRRRRIGLLCLFLNETFSCHLFFALHLHRARIARTLACIFLFSEIDL